MPVRKIPKNYLCVTGSFASRKNRRMLGFESLLERDFMILLEFDEDVEGFEEQPVRIAVTGRERRRVSYVPDILIHYRETGARPRKPLLAEVKARRDLEKHKDKYAPKFSAAKSYAKERDWQFKVVDDSEIRIERLPNLKFLREYHLISPASEDIQQVMEGIETAGGWVELEELLTIKCKDDDDRLNLLPVIWHLVAIGRIEVDIDTPFTDRTPLALPKHARGNE
jgi:hypothetical protein